ncbi:hypothetical protein [Paenibacillus sp. MSJ-34]|nr:hypothetical protein [Paenibacillus sp. MSJ-34]MBU5444530.1 hypothetical protein [Paenibacillus sp. MSJ-34]
MNNAHTKELPERQWTGVDRYINGHLVPSDPALDPPMRNKSAPSCV